MLSEQDAHKQSAATVAGMPLGDRIIALATRLAEWSETPDGLTCTYLTPTHRAVAAQLRDWMTAAGMSVTIDAVGNVVGRYASADPAAKTLIVGSHYDTVFNAGNYDGRLGILTGLVAVEELHRTGTAAAVPSRPDRICRGGGRAFLRALYRQQRDRRTVRPRAVDAARCRRPDRRRPHPQIRPRSRQARRAGAPARRPAGLSGSAHRAGAGAAAAGSAGRGRDVDRRQSALQRDAAPA